MAKFRKQAVVIDAVRLTEPILIDTLEGQMQGQIGDWLITGVKGEQYPCKDDVFRASYETLDGKPVPPGFVGQQPGPAADFTPAAQAQLAQTGYVRLDGLA